ncbi:hypothetical protein SISSUDRAFT_1040664 [Sistotremastrum suecicum HHB10207 ss-3]|uniref:F-box domain-containing protein n=1 Tax=Sistotremastrum suecicum HHB10207 ss-3 TaxID=1314776 RepID=A0A166HYM5_9AGAM|nr:hypothetical protein SISSUDRAFT_1040664 [Sistotremastrum suecicum HHB10207 ss-3]
MSFNKIPVELMTKILNNYMSDESSLEGSDQRLVHTLRLGLINRRSRAIALAESHIWKTIHLHWPEEIVDEYLRRAQQNGISLFLDTFCGPHDKATIDTNIQRWSAFLQSNMAAFKHLDLCIRSAACSQALSAALETSAPHLQTFKLVLGNFQITKNLFAGNAPALRTAHLDTRHSLEITSFPFLSTASLRVCQENCRRILLALQSMSQLEDITLFGTEDYTDVPAQAATRRRRRLRPIVLPFCRRLRIRNMVSFSVRRLMANIRAPLLEDLEIRETVTVADDALIPTPIPLALASVPRSPVDPTALHIELHADRVRIKLDGTTRLHYLSDWSRVQTVAPGDHRVLDAVTNLLTSLSTISGGQPVTISIDNNIFCHSAPLTLLKGMNMHLLWSRVFCAYPHVHTLEVAGDVTEASEILFNLGRNSILPLLSRLHIRSIRPGTLLPMYKLQRIQEVRDLELVLPQIDGAL